MARTTGTIKHTHKYFRRRDRRWACAGKDGCTHFLPKNMDPLPAGMLSDCWGCDNEFMLTPANMMEDQPKCDKCALQEEVIGEWLDSKGMNEKTEDPVVRAYRLAKEKAMRKESVVEKKEPVIEEDKPTWDE